MHQSAYDNCLKFSKKYIDERAQLRVLDVGSYDVNGTLRPIFTKEGWEYTGLDYSGTPENNVTVCLEDPYNFPFENNYFDTVVSSSAFEHDPLFWVTFKEMTRVLKADGYIYLNAPSTGPYHGYPGDCWRFYKDAYPALASWCPEVALVENYIDPSDPQWNDNVGVFKKN